MKINIWNTVNTYPRATHKTESYQVSIQMSVKRLIDYTSSKSCQMWFHARFLASRDRCVSWTPWRIRCTYNKSHSHSHQLQSPTQYQSHIVLKGHCCEFSIGVNPEELWFKMQEKEQIYNSGCHACLSYPNIMPCFRGSMSEARVKSTSPILRRCLWSLDVSIDLIQKKSNDAAVPARGNLIQQSWSSVLWPRCGNAELVF
jgi:hypothetical protein